jgi:hypothetical protein
VFLETHRCVLWEKKRSGMWDNSFFFLGDFIWTEASWNQDIKKEATKNKQIGLEDDILLS